MLRTVRNRIAALRAQGKTEDEIVAAKPTADFDARWGGGFMKPDARVGLVYDSMS
jgi:cyclase